MYSDCLVLTTIHRLADAAKVCIMCHLLPNVQIGGELTIDGDYF